jgi:hypothetical protein
LAILVTEAAPAVAAILCDFAALRAAAPDQIRRLRDLSSEALASLSALPEAAAPAPRMPPRRAGLFALENDRFAALVGLPFGRCDAETLDRLGAALAKADIRLSPWRGLAFRDLDRTGAEALLRLAGDLGLITQDDDPRLSVQACAGSACSRAEAPTMADAAVLAAAAASLLVQGVTLHVSGCVKACAHPAAADLTLVGRDGATTSCWTGRRGTSRSRRLTFRRCSRDCSPDRIFRPAEGRAFDRIAGLSKAYDYIQDGAAIYERSFAIIRAEADLARFSGAAERVVVRMIHACGMTDLPKDVEISAGFAEAAQAALKAGAPILCDAKMVANGVTRARLPANNEVLCTLDDPQVPALAAQMGTTRSAAAMELWKPRLAGHRGDRQCADLALPPARDARCRRRSRPP